MGPRRNELASEQQHAEEGGFQEERREALVAHQRRHDIGGRIRIPAPVGAELERHDDAGDHAHAEREGEDLYPEVEMRR